MLSENSSYNSLNIIDDVQMSVSTPLLRWGIVIEVDADDTASLRFENSDYAFKGISADVMKAVCARLNGKQDAVSVASSLGLPVSKVQKIFELMSAHNLTVNPQKGGIVSPEEFSDKCRVLFPEWKQRLFSHPLWKDLSSGKSSESQFLGWLLESYHFIAGVNVRLALAVAECSEPSIRALFAHHYSEEYDHCHFFMSALNRFELSKDDVNNANPPPGTRAVLNFMRQCARTDSLQYAVCSGFLESTGDDRGRGREFFSRLVTHYAPNNTPAIQPLIEHINLDEEYGHNNLMEGIVEQLGDIPVERASAALNAGAILVETLEMWSNDILLNYATNEFKLRLNSNGYRVKTFAA